MRPARSAPTGILGAIRGAAIRTLRRPRAGAPGIGRADRVDPADPLAARLRPRPIVRRSAAHARPFDVLERLALAWFRRRMRAAAGRVIVRHAEEHRQIGLRLYAGPAQQLSLALLRLDALTAVHPSGSPDGLGNELELVSRAVADGLSEMRAIASSIRTPDLEALDLAGVVERALRDRRREPSSAVSVRLLEPLPEVSVAVKTVLFQTVRGLVGSMAEDPRASVELRLSGDAGSLGLSARTHGQDLPEASDWAAIRERAELLGGSIRVEHEPIGGLTLEAVLPVRVED